MNENNFQQISINKKKESESLNLNLIVGQLINFWWLFVVFILLSVLTAYIYLRYTAPTYKISAKILVKDSRKGGDISQQSIFADLQLLDPISSVDNEVELLKSRTLMEKTVDKLQLNNRYFSKGSVKQSEIFYTKLPFILNKINFVEDSINANSIFSFIGIDEGHFKLEFEKHSKTYSYGDTLNFRFGQLVFNRLAINPPVTTSPVIIKFYSRDATVDDIKSTFTVATTTKTVSTIDLTVTDNIPARGALILNTLINIYNQLNSDDRNQTADNTIAFIDNRLVYVTNELGNVEKNIQTYKQENKLSDITMQGQLLLQNTSQVGLDLARQEVQIEVLQILQSYLRSDKNFSRTIPAALAVQDPTFEAQVQKYNDLQLEKQRQLSTTTENNPLVEKLSIQIANLRTSILNSLTTIGQTMKVNRDQLKRRLDEYTSEIRGVPQKERTFLEISRQQSIKQELYLYLLKKREETAVSKAANLSNARIVDAGKSENSPFKPKSTLIYLAAFLAGIAIPGLIIYLRQLIYNKIDTKSDITSLTNAPIIGEIGRSPFPNNLIVKENPRHPIAEQFRLLRTNLDYLNISAKGGRTVMVTSSMSGEGKSFISLNLATILALGGKKVVLLEFDLRKPKLSKYLGFTNNEGISTFLMNKSKSLEQLTIKVPDTESLYFIGSGPIPPNPTEFINGDITVDLFSQLREKFDHIVIDVPPVGIVTDALLLAKYVQISLYIIRQGFTFKAQVENADELYQLKKLPNFALVVNDIDRQKGYGYGSGYGYGTSYGYGYTEEK